MEEKEKPINECETQTLKDDSNEPKTKYEKFCKRFGINPNLVMLKMTLFFMYGGKYDKFKFHYQSN